ncbi:MAG: 30S ribosome-binding factor RbfA [Balneolaceae bacterium]
MSIRMERLAAVIQKDLGEILQKKYQPEGTLVTVNGVKMTPDLSIARVYLSVLSPGKDPAQTLAVIDDHIKEIRYELASRIRHQVRKIPELHFYEDDSAQYVNRMEQLFQKVREDRGEKE